MADNFNLRQFLTENKLTKNAKLIKEEVSEATPPTMQAGFDSVAAQSKQSENLKRIANELFPEFGGDLENLKPLSPEQRKEVYYELHKQSQLSEEVEYPDDIQWIPLSNSPSDSYDEEVEMLGWSESTNKYFEGSAFNDDFGHVDIDKELIPRDKAQEKALSKHFTKNNINENKMTSRDKYLTRIVENALGLQVTKDDNVDYSMGNQDDKNQLANPASQISIPEGEEMVQEKPLPKYENIERLMQEIDKSTDEEAHKFKMQEMKRVADMLEKKCTALEEGDDADHIDQKKLKQMKKDIMTLRKGIEKMEKLGEKKFTKKETKQSKPAESLAENRKTNTMEKQFDLKKFLTENKLTTNSRMLKEEVGAPISYEKLKQILLLACNTYPEDDQDGMALYEKSDVKHTLKYIMTLEKGVKNGDFDVFDKLEGQEPATLEGIVNLDDVQSAKWDDFDLTLSVVSSIAYEYDLDDAASALGDLAKAVDSFQL